MEELQKAAALVSSRAGVAPRVGIILGSGLGKVAGELRECTTISYGDIPGFPCTTVPGHQGELVLGTLEGTGVAAMKGRPHLFEGYSPRRLGFPVALMHSLGVRLLVVTNAAGGLRPGVQQGALMVLEDHINLPGLAGLNPLMGTADGEERFVNMTGAYDQGLRNLVLDMATGRGLQAFTGVYAMVGGPSYETPSEARLLRQMGADAVGMSTVPEVLVARSLGMRVVGLSCITNVLLGPRTHGEVSHLGVLSVAEGMVPHVAFILRMLVRKGLRSED